MWPSPFRCFIRGMIALDRSNYQSIVRPPPLGFGNGRLMSARAWQIAYPCSCYCVPNGSPSLTRQTVGGVPKFIVPLRNRRASVSYSMRPSRLRDSVSFGGNRGMCVFHGNTNQLPCDCCVSGLWVGGGKGSADSRAIAEASLGEWVPIRRMPRVN